MIQKIRLSHRLSVCLIVLSGSLTLAQAQTTAVAEPYPDPTAAAGMTSGMPNGMTAQQIEMMRVRTEAQTAQGEAAAASMARSVDATMEAANRERTLQEAREVKAIKRSMLDRLKWERANTTQVNKVTSDEMSSWNTANGNVRVERDVPDPFLQALIEEERILMENGTIEKPKKGFTPLKSTGAVLTSPFRMFSKEDEAAYAPSAASVAVPAQSTQISGGGGMFSNLKMPKIGGRNQPEPYTNPASAEPQFVGSSSPAASSQSAPQTVSAASSSASTIPRISGAELVDGRSPVNDEQGAASANPYVTDSGPSMNAAPAATPQVEPEKTGFFSKFKSNDQPVASNSGGGGFFGLGKKKESAGSGEPGIDASLFPEGAVAQQPTGANLSGGYDASDVAQEAQSVPSSTGSFALPGEEPEKKKFGFSMPKPNISIPTIGGGSGSNSSSVPTLTTINSAGNDYYVVTSAAQFMVYGDDQMQSEIRALPAGTIVRMTKPGDQWASVQLPGGASGIVQNKFLRGASSSEAGGQIAFSN